MQIIIGWPTDITFQANAAAATTVAGAMATIITTTNTLILKW
jgi:hypothetical protein